LKGEPMQRRESGYAVLAVVATMVTIAAAVVVGWATLATRVQTDGLASVQQQYLDEVRVSLLGWYARDLAQIDRSAEPPDPVRMLRGTGVAVRWGLRVAASERLVREGIAYRVIAAWLPGEGDTSMLEPATGRFTPSSGTRWIVVSGFDLQAAALVETRARLDRLARQLEAAYRARLLSDPSRDATVNRFRAVRCSAPSPGELPCIDEYVTIDVSGLASAAGLDPLLAANAWGAPIEVSNGIDASLVIPFSMALRTATPWGGSLSMFAVSAP
jgi:hypothetical protein